MTLFQIVLALLTLAFATIAAFAAWSAARSMNLCTDHAREIIRTRTAESRDRSGRRDRPAADPSGLLTRDAT
jgi:hypothetical protein